MNKTQKKIPIYSFEKSKKFVRKSSLRSEKSFQGKRGSKDQKFNEQHFIKTPKLTQSTIGMPKMNFFRSLASSLIINEPAQIKHQEINQKQIKTELNNLRMKTQNFQNQIQLLNKQYQMIKLSQKEEKQKRRYLQLENKQLLRQNNRLKKITEQLQIQIKKLLQQKEYFKKQIQYLQKINYDDKTRSIQSFRQQYLQLQLQRLRKQMKMSKSDQQLKLEQQIQKINQQKYALESHYKALKLANQCLLKQITDTQTDCRDYIVNSNQYITLREKYKNFLDQYKNLRTEYWTLKMKVQNRNNQSSLLSMTISSLAE